jgi:hypothetical protein
MASQEPADRVIMLRFARRFKRVRAEDGEEGLKLLAILETYDMREPSLAVGCFIIFLRRGL